MSKGMPVLEFTEDELTGHLKAHGHDCVYYIFTHDGLKLERVDFYMDRYERNELGKFDSVDDAMAAAEDDEQYRRQGRINEYPHI